MKRIHFLLAASAAVFGFTVLRADVTFYTSKAAFDLVVGTTLLEDFESFSQKDTLLPSFTSNGVTYTAFAGAPSPNLYVTSPGATQYGAGVAQPTTSSILTSNGDEDFAAVFSTPVTAFGLDTYLNGLGTATLRVFNGGLLLGSYAYPGEWNTKEYLGVVSTEPITSFRWSGAGGGVLNTGIDNISVLIPEPGQTALMLAVILLVAAWCGQRRQRGC
jgi:hypothetical protein